MLPGKQHVRVVELIVRLEGLITFNFSLVAAS